MAKKIESETDSAIAMQQLVNGHLNELYDANAMLVLLADHLNGLNLSGDDRFHELSRVVSVASEIVKRFADDAFDYLPPVKKEKEASHG